jgi:hypothetical protein
VPQRPLGSTSRHRWDPAVVTSDSPLQVIHDRTAIRAWVRRAQPSRVAGASLSRPKISRRARKPSVSSTRQLVVARPPTVPRALISRTWQLAASRHLDRTNRRRSASTAPREPSFHVRTRLMPGRASRRMGPRVLPLRGKLARPDDRFHHPGVADLGERFGDVERVREERRRTIARPRSRRPARQHVLPGGDGPPVLLVARPAWRGFGGTAPPACPGHRRKRAVPTTAGWARDLAGSRSVDRCFRTAASRDLCGNEVS